MGIVTLGALGARFVVPSPLWLDEALSVNIARLPLSSLAEALRHDGHPPLYYVLLHGWMTLFGTSDLAVRALSGVLSLLTLPLAFRAGRRVGGNHLGWMTVVVLGLSPYFLRFGSETRMYSLVILLVFAGYLLISESIDPDDPRGLTWLRGVGIAVVGAALLWTHYWAMWLVAAVGLLLAIRLALLRRRSGSWDRTTVGVLAAVAAGAATFVAWLPVLAYQARHTGTPWADPFEPAAMIVTSIQQFAGGPYSEPQVLLLLLIVLLMVGIMGRGVDDWRVDLDLRSRPDARVPALVLVTTMGVASVAGIVTRSAFAPRYAAIFFPFFVLLIALGLDHLRGRVVRTVVLGTFVLLSLVGLALTFRQMRTQAGDIAAAIRRANAAGAVVVTCPDQLGPSIRRTVPAGLEVTTYPRFGDPRYVDWVDYTERNRRNDPERFADELLKRAEGRTIFAVVNNGFLTLGNQCDAMVAALGRVRRAELIRDAAGDRYVEAMSLYILRP